MKKKMIVICFLLLASLSTVAGASDSQNEVLHWYNNETSAEAPTEDFADAGSINDLGYWASSGVAGTSQGITKPTGEWGEGRAINITKDSPQNRGEATGSYVRTDPSSDLNSDSITVSLWYKHRSDCDYYSCYQWSKMDSNKNYRGITSLFVNSTHVRVWARDGQDDTVSFDVDPAIDIRDGNWHHITYRFDNSDGNLSYYVDGTHIRSEANSAVDSPGSLNYNFSVGVDRNDERTPGFLSDEIHIYNTAITESEINSLYENNTLDSTSSSNSAPSLNNPDPSDGSASVNDTDDATGIDVDLGIDYSDSDGDSGTVTFYWQNGTQIDQQTGISSGTTVTYQLEDLAEGTNYNWYAEASDGNGGSASAGNYSFTTASSSSGSISTNYNIVDDFEDGDKSEYTKGELSNFDVIQDSSNSAEGSYYFEGTADNGNHPDILSSSGLNYYPSQGGNFTQYFNIQDNTGFKDARIGFARDSNAYGNGYFVCWSSGGGCSGQTQGIYIIKRNGNGDEKLAGSSFDISANTNEWIHVNVDWADDGNITVTLEDSSDNEITSLSAVDTTFTEGSYSLHLNSGGGFGKVWYDAPNISSSGGSSNSDPSASFTTSKTDLTVDVDASGSSDSDGSISSYEWDWTNDGTYEGSGETASHTYGSDGTYTIKLRVTDDDGATSTTTNSVSVSSGSSSVDKSAYNLDESSTPLTDIFQTNDLDSISGSVNFDVSGISKSNGDWGQSEAIGTSGSGNYVYDGNPSGLSVGSNDEYIVSAWVYIRDSGWSDTGSVDGSLTGLDDDSTRSQLFIDYNANGNGNYYAGGGIKDDSGQNAFVFPSTSNNEVSPNNWYHLAFIRQSDGTLDFYLNNSFIGSASGATDGLTVNWVGALTFKGGTTPIPNGKVDEVGHYITKGDFTSNNVSNLYTCNQLSSCSTASTINLNIDSPSSNEKIASETFWLNGTVDTEANVTAEFNGNGTNLEICENCTSFSNRIGTPDVGSFNVSVQAVEYGNSSNTDSVTRDFEILPFQRKPNWTQASENPFLVPGSQGTSSDNSGIEGTTALYDNVSGQYKVLYWGQGSNGGTVELATAESLMNPQGGEYDKQGTVINPSWNVAGLSVIDDRDTSDGNVKLYVPDGQNIHLFTSSDDDFTSWTDQGTVFSGAKHASVQRLEDGTYVAVAHDNSQSEGVYVWYSSDGVSWNADSNNPVLGTTGLDCDGQDFSTFEVFDVMKTTNDSKVYTSFECNAGIHQNDYETFIAYSDYSDLTDGDESSSWNYANEGRNTHLDPSAMTGWASSGVVGEMKTYYLPEGDSDHVYAFLESWEDGASRSNSSVGVVRTELYHHENIESAPDTTPPSLTIHSPPNSTISDSELDLNVTSSEAVSTWKYSLDGSANTTFTPNITLTGLSDGSHTVDVYGKDSDGNTGSESVTFTVNAETFVQINDSVQINQTANNAYVNVTDSLNVTSLKVYDTSTTLGNINWSISGDTADRIDVKLSHFSDENFDDTYLANYSVDTAVGNVVTSKFSPVALDSVYQVFRDGSFFKQVQADANQVADIGYEQVNSAYRGFAVKRTDQFRPEINSTTYKLDQQNSLERLEFVLWAHNNANDITSSSGTGTRIELTNTSMIYDVSLPLSDRFSVTDTEGLTRNRFIDMSKTDSGVIEDTGFQHDLNSQKRIQELNISNNGDTWTLYNWTSQLGNTFTGNISTGGIESVEDSETSDYLNNKSYGFSPESGEIVLGFDYDGAFTSEVDNTVSTAFTSVNTSGGYGEVNQCSQINNSEIDVAGNEFKNYSIGHLCDPGSIGNPVQEVNNITGGDRVWINSTDMNINTNKTENNSIVIRTDKSQWQFNSVYDGGSLEAYVEGVNSVNNKELNITDTGSFFRIKVGTSFQSSSLQTDDSHWAVSYTNTDTSDDDTGGGGGGGTEPSEDQIVYFGSDETSDGIETVGVPLGETVVRNMSVTNERQSPVTVQVSTGNTGVCRYVSVQRTQNSRKFGDSGTYDVGAATQTLGTVETTEKFSIRYSLPNRTVLDEEGISDLSCKFETASSYGVAEPLVVEVEEGFSLKGFLSDIPLLGDWLQDDLFCYPTGDINNLDASVDQCVKNWQATLFGLLGLVVVALGRRNRWF